MNLSSATSFPGALPDWSNLDVLHHNRLSPRAHFHLYDSEEAALTFNSTQSSIQSLNGEWKFHYDPSPFDAPPWDSADPSSWDDIQVPGMWQLQGDYGRPQYTNVIYPIPVTPPNVTYTNPTGSYWREFDVPSGWEGEQVRLRFEGVDSAFHVWVNGEEVGYSQGARNPSEFDITDFLAVGGTNEVAARVYQWSDGTYIEDQDQWWLSGIFRDVYLAPFPQESIVDLHVGSELDDDFESGAITANFTVQGDGDGEVQVKLLAPDGETLLDEWTGSPSETYTSAELQGDDLRLWSAETPSLYTLLVTYNDRTISQKAGVRRVEMVGSNFHVNGRPIMLLGVNRHEHHPLSGRTVPYDFMRADLVRMKQSNINTIRTAHQPPDPDFFDVADELGFYVIAEADLECHGFRDVEGYRDEDEEEFAAQWTTENPDWEDAYVDRVEQVVQRYRNHASVIIWSMGNECFYGSNIAAMADWVREHDSTRILHYEQDHEAQSMDLYSQMYSDPDEIRDFLESHTDKPFMLCEYAHAMGNGPGGLRDYIDLFRSEPLIQGGLVWEWSNHGLLKREGDVEFYAYGGDFGDEPNDADFILDGLLLSDHTPMPSLIEYAKVIQPVSVALAADDNSSMVVTNHYDFVDLSALDASWHLVQDDRGGGEGGSVNGSQPLNLPQVPAGENRTVDLPISAADLPQEAWVTVEFRLKEDTLWAERGHVVAWDQLHIPGPRARQARGMTGLAANILPAAAAVSPRQDEGEDTGNVDVTRNATHLTVESGGSTFGFDLLQGNVTWTVDGVDLFRRGPELNFYRGYTQNDESTWGDGQQVWDSARVGQMETQVREVTWGEDLGGDNGGDGGFTVHYKVRVGPVALEWGTDADLVYTIVPSASAPSPSLRVRAHGDFDGANTPETLPRIGLLAVLPGEFDDVAWFGRGPGENYRDSKEGSRVGRYEASVPELFTNYDYPQENGNREDLRWVQIGADGATTLDARRPGGEAFSFTAIRHMPFDLDDATHPHDLEPLDVTVLHLDYDTNGLGSASVGPRPFEPHRCLPEAFDFTFELSVV